ncbi:MAG: M20 family metallo-hydrolase, partial [Candidatus Latescibacterota bacterium]
MKKDALDAVVSKIDGYRDELINLQTELTRRPALGPESDGEGELEKARYLQEYLEDMGLKVDRYDSPDERVPSGVRPNLVAVLDGERLRPTLWIMTHIDVVPPGDRKLWSGDPWTVRVDGDKLIGRGVEDNQGGMVSSLLAVKALLETGTRPNIPVGLVLVSDEETGSVHGLQYLLRERANLFSKDDLIIVPDSGSPNGVDIEVAEKSILWIKVRTLGKQTHGSVPEKGINAHKAAAYMITRMNTLYHRFRKQNDLFQPPGSTFEPTKKEANVPNVNTIPGEDVFYFDCRILPDYKLSEILKAVREIARETRAKFRVKVEMEYPQKESAAPPTPSDAPVVSAIQRAVKQLRGRRTRPIGIGGGTVAKYFRDAGFPCAVWCTMDERAHTPDEYAIIP